MDDVINQESWMQIEEKKQGVKILCRIPQGYADAQLAYFKYPLNENMGPIAANEYIAAKLAEMLDLPINRTFFKEFEGKKGFLTFATPGQPNMWRQFPYKEDIEHTLNDFENLARLILFDIWILNTDRNPDNLMYTKIGRSKKFDYFLIDHAHSLYGPNPQPNDYNSYNFGSMIQIPELRNLLQKGFTFFKEHIDDIKNVDNISIIDLLNTIPEEYLKAGEKNAIKDLLIHRRDQLEEKFSEFLANPNW